MRGKPGLKTYFVGAAAGLILTAYSLTGIYVHNQNVNVSEAERSAFCKFNDKIIETIQNNSVAEWIRGVYENNAVQLTKKDK